MVFFATENDPRMPEGVKTVKALKALKGLKGPSGGPYQNLRAQSLEPRTQNLEPRNQNLELIRTYYIIIN